MASDPAVLQRMVTSFTDIMLECGRFREVAAALQTASAKRKQRLANPAPGKCGPCGRPANRCTCPPAKPPSSAQPAAKASN